MKPSDGPLHEGGVTKRDFTRRHYILDAGDWANKISTPHFLDTIIKSTNGK